MPRRPCVEPRCPHPAMPGKARCAQQERARDRQRGTTAQRGYGYAWQQHARQAIADHLATHGLLCPGFDRDAHVVDLRSLCCDHDLGVMCRSCNSRKGATSDKQRARTSDGEGAPRRRATNTTPRPVPQRANSYKADRSGHWESPRDRISRTQARVSRPRRRRQQPEDAMLTVKARTLGVDQTMSEEAEL
jgi:hypothetical protein